ILNSRRNGEEWFNNLVFDDRTGGEKDDPGEAMHVAASARVEVQLSPMAGGWLPAGDEGKPLLVGMRLGELGGKEICLGVVLDGESLPALLVDEVQDLFPGARLEPATDESPLDRTMTVLPLCLHPGPLSVPSESRWTPSRIGLCLAWVAALVALLAVGLV